MNKFLSTIFLFSAVTAPTALALAHGNGDGHDEAEAVADPSMRKYVMIGVGVVFALMLAYIINSKMKSKAPMGDTTPPTTPPTSTN